MLKGQLAIDQQPRLNITNLGTRQLSMASHSDLANLIWQTADLLRRPYRPPQWERVMLPLVVLRRVDCVLEDTKPKRGFV